MLQRIRDNASGPIAYAIVGLITLVFGVWGIGSYFTPSANPVVASVGDASITKYELKQAYNQRYRRLRAMMGERFDADAIEPTQLRRAVLQRMIRKAVMQQYALDAGYRTTDQALLQALKNDPRFQRNGKFSSQRYHTLLANNGLKAAAFEASLRRRMVSDQVRQNLLAGAFAAPAGVSHAYSLQQQKRKVAYLVFPAAAYRDKVDISPNEIKTWYNNHGDQYMRPERVKLAYVELDRAALSSDQAITKNKLKQFYQEHKAQFSTPDTRDAKQVFVPVNKDKAAARNTIQELATQLQQGGTLDELTARTGDNVQVKQLHDATRAQLPRDLAQALFSVDVGHWSTPVRAKDGWYLFKPTAEQQGQTQPFEAAQVQKSLKKMARNQWRSRHFSKLSKKMQALAFQAPNSLKTLSKELDLPVQTTGWLTRKQGEQLGQYKAVRKAAFSDAVLNKRLNSEVIQVAQGRKIVVRVAKRQPPERIPLEQVKQQIKAQLGQHKAQKLARQAASQAREQARQGKSLARIAQSTPAHLKQPGYVGRTSSSVPTQVRIAAFAASRPEQDSASYQLAHTDDAAMLVALSDIKQPKAKAGDVPKRFVQSQRRYVAQLGYAAFAQYLNKHADVEINKGAADL